MLACVLKPSLKHLSLVKITIGLLDEDFIEELVASKSYEDNEIIKNQIEKLSIPRHLKRSVSNFVRPIVIEIELWNNYHKSFMNRRLKDNFCKLFWISNGTIDRKKTAIALVEDDDLDVTVRYEIARMYCLEDYIVVLWMQISDDGIESDSAMHIDETADNDIDWRLEHFRTSFVQRHFLLDLDETEDTYQTVKYAFKYAALVGNKVAAEYFLKQFAPQERIKSVTETIRFMCHNLCHFDILFENPQLNSRYCVDVLIFLLLEVDEEVQRNTINTIKGEDTESFDILKYFLDWPWQNLFLEVAECMWPIFIDYKESYYDLLLHITEKVRSGFKDYDYYELFGRIWMQSPLPLKAFVTDTNDQRLLNAFSIIEDGEKYIKVIWKDE